MAVKRKKQKITKRNIYVPQKVRVAGLEWECVFDPLLCAREGVFGMTSMDKQQIVLDPTMSDDMVMATFLHELIHVVNFQYGNTKHLDRKMEEVVTNTISNGLFAAIRDNGLVF